MVFGMAIYFKGDRVLWRNKYTQSNNIFEPVYHGDPLRKNGGIGIYTIK
jgi:hypothetical protein